MLKVEEINREILKNNFAIYATKHSNAMLEGDHKSANKIHTKIMKINGQIKDKGLQDIYLEYLDHANDSVKLWAASFLLKNKPEIALKCLKDLATRSTMISNTAELVIKAWKSGNLL